MVLTSIHLKNFRSHANTELKFSRNLNYIVGGNGQGKTSILEAIYYLCTTKSNNSKTDNEVVRFKENEFEIKGKFSDITTHDTRVFYSLPENKKYYFQNNKLVSRSSEIIGKFPVVLLTPDDHSITQGGPSDRRKFVDSILSQASEVYLKNLLDYNKTLRQRSSLLSRIRESGRKDFHGELDAWTIKLIETGTEIIKYRLKFIDVFNSYINESYQVIMGTEEIPSVEYSFLEGAAEGNIKGEFEKIVLQKREEELRRTVNLVGPHRDDFLFDINGINLRTFGSQGQHKTFQVVLRFAQFFYLKEITGKAPIFLLDDVFGELDAFRTTKISEYLREVGQAFITITDFANMSFLKRNEDDLLINVYKGTTTYA